MEEGWPRAWKPKKGVRLNRTPCLDAEVASTLHTHTKASHGAAWKSTPVHHASRVRNQTLEGSLLIFFSTMGRTKREEGSTHSNDPSRLLPVCFSDTLETAQCRENSSHMLRPAFPERIQRRLCQHCSASQPQRDGLCQGKTQPRPWRWGGALCILQRESGALSEPGTSPTTQLSHTPLNTTTVSLGFPNPYAAGLLCFP